MKFDIKDVSINMQSINHRTGMDVRHCDYLYTVKHNPTGMSVSYDDSKLCLRGVNKPKDIAVKALERFVNDVHDYLHPND